MNETDVTVVRVYLTETEHRFEKVMRLLHDEEQVRGVTAFRGIAGFGRSGQVHLSTLLDISHDLPLVIEFFDRPEKVERVLERLSELIDPGHVLSWPARVNDGF